MNGATEIHVTTHTFHAIPLLECLPAGPGPFPLVFFLPGFTGSRMRRQVRRPTAPDRRARRPPVNHLRR